MNTVIWKYPIGPGPLTMNIMMPKDAEILSMQLQRGMPTMWAMVDPDAPRVTRQIRTYPTGGFHSGFEEAGEFLGTYQLEDMELVYHVFDSGEV